MKYNSQTLILSASAVAASLLVSACGGGSSSAPVSSQATLVAVPASTSLNTSGTTSLSTTGGSGSGAVTFSSTGGCTVTGTTLTAPATAATCNVTASKAADSAYLVATSAAVPVTVAAPSYTLSSGLKINGITANNGAWGYYGGSTSNATPGFANGAFLDGTGGQLAASAADTYVGYYQNLIAADVSGYSYSGNYITYPGTTGLAISGATNIVYGVAVNSEWLANAAGAKFVVILESKLTGVSTSTCNPSVAAVVTATSKNMTTYTTPLTSFTKIAQNCGSSTVTAAQILAGAITKVDFQVDGGGSAMTASGLTSTGNTNVFTGGTAPNTGTGPYLPVVLLINGVVKFQ